MESPSNILINKKPIDLVESVKPDITYRCCNLSSDEITTFMFGGGAAYGFVYLGFIKFCEGEGLLKNLENVVGVSVGSMISLFLALGYTYNEIYKSVNYEIDLAKILEINGDNIFNILDQLGINNGAYVEEIIKNIIAAKGMSPYITFKDLADAQLGPKLNVGYTRSFHNDFFMANAVTTPDMPIWLAIRASISIPIILTPVIDYSSNDILCDGGIVNNTPIKWYLADWWQSKPDNHINCHQEIDKTTKFKDATTQTDIDNTESTVIDSNNNQAVQLDDNICNINYRMPKKKYRQHFWCNEIKTLTNSPVANANDLKSISIGTYISWTIHKIFANQDASRDKYATYLCQLDSKNYPEINIQKLNLDLATRNIIINRAYEEYKKYYYENLLVS